MEAVVCCLDLLLVLAGLGGLWFLLAGRRPSRLSNVAGTFVSRVRISVNKRPAATLIQFDVRKS